MNREKLARELVRIAKEIVAVRVPPAVRREVDKGLKKHERKFDFDDFDELYDKTIDLIMDVIENDYDSYEEGLEVAHEWADPIVDDWAKELELD